MTDDLAQLRSEVAKERMARLEAEPVQVKSKQESAELQQRQQRQR
jgi:hypothetical protein